jgi:hypothetical protein
MDFFSGFFYANGPVKRFTDHLEYEQIGFETKASVTTAFSLTLFNNYVIQWRPEIVLFDILPFKFTIEYAKLAAVLRGKPMALYAKFHHNVQFLVLNNYFIKDVTLPWISWVDLALGNYFLNFSGASQIAVIDFYNYYIAQFLKFNGNSEFQDDALTFDFLGNVIAPLLPEIFFWYGDTDYFYLPLIQLPPGWDAAEPPAEDGSVPPPPPN